MTAPAQVERPVADESADDDRPWVTIVWNDPVNLKSYVTYVLQELVRTKLARFAVPRSVEVHDELPRNATGKVLKRELRG